MVTSAQLRAARGLLNWTVRELAEKAGVHRNTITRAEAETSRSGHAVAQIVRTLEGSGVEFLDREGLRWARRGTGDGTIDLKDLNASNDE